MQNRKNNKTMDIKDNPITFDFSKVKSEKKPYNYQQKAIDDLERHFILQDNKKSLLQIPTGGGKTYTTVRWLFNSLLHKDYKIVWITHRIDLLEQARNTMIEESALLKGLSKKPKCFMIGGGYARGTTLAVAKESVIFITSQTLSKSNGHKAMVSFCRKNKNNNVIFVIDEAHRSASRTMADFINKTINKYDNFKLLGLTATPTRTVEKEKYILLDLFDRSLISGININKLIKDGHLAWPKPEKIETAINFEGSITEKTKAFFDSRKELDPEFLNAIGKNSLRNKIIVDTYLKNKKRYGKTLIFAIDILHARTLKSEFQAHKNINADATFSGVENHTEIIRKFQNGDLDVLINVAKLTEGFDAPKIQSVFLTRPTQSEILFSQMIGRGLRGGIKGTKDVYLVSFEDHWDQFDGWLDTQSINTIFELEEEVEKLHEKEPKNKMVFQTISFDIIDQVYQQMRHLNLPELAGNPSFECWPIGWYALDYENDIENELPISRTVIVFSHQKQSWDGLAKAISKKERSNIDAEQLYKYWFYDLPSPGVSKSIMDLFIDACYATGEYIEEEFYTLENRDEASVDNLAKILYEDSVGGKLRQERIQEWYDQYSLLSDIYSSIENFTEAVDYSSRRITFPDNYQMAIPTGPQYIVEEKLKVNIADTDDKKLISVFKELKADKELFPNGFDYNPKLEWTHRVMKSYFGMAYLDSDNLKIKINRILNSSDIAQNEELIKFIMYHEMLHFSVSKNHDSDFRLHESKYPDIVNLNSILDRVGFKFDIDSKYK